MADLKRRPWTDADNRSLIGLWPRIGSIVLIALELGRSSSSVQTQASRLGLPRRIEGNDRHRRRWTDADVKALETSIANRQRKDGKFPIHEISDDIGRSIDAVVAKMAETHGGESEIFDRIVVTKQHAAAVPLKKPAAQDPAVDPRKIGKMRPCMTCSRTFWSEGAWNRRCISCKSTESDTNWDW
jgi:hypothetical protein